MVSDPDEEGSLNTLRRGAVTCLLAVCCLPAASAQANPFFWIGEGSNISWQQAIRNQSVMPVRASQVMTRAEQEFYAEEAAMHNIQGFQLRDAVLTGDVGVSDGTMTHQSLVMAWETAGSQANNLAMWRHGNTSTARTRT